MSNSSKSDWNDENSVLVHEQPTLGGYVNSDGQIVLRRQRAWDEAEDTYIEISAEFVPKVARALMSAAYPGRLAARSQLS